MQPCTTEAWCMYQAWVRGQHSYGMINLLCVVENVV